LIALRGDTAERKQGISRPNYLIRTRAAILLRDIAPLIVAYIATYVGTRVVVQSFPSPERTAYLIASVVIPQLGLWADWGRGTTPLVTLAGRPSAFRQAIRGTLRRLPLLSVPTIMMGTLLLVVIPLRDQVPSPQLLGVAAAVVTATVMVSQGNVLRNALLYFDQRSAYFWVQLWVAGGIPVLVGVCHNTQIGILLAGSGYLLTLIAMTWRQMGWTISGSVSHAPSAALPSRRAFLRGDKLGWAIGSAQIVTAVSAAIELPLLAALDATAVLLYFSVSRFAQATIAIAVRPMERALPDAVLAAGTDAPADVGRCRWRDAVRYSLVLAVTGGLALVAYGSPLARVWLGVSPSLSLLVVAAIVVITSTVYRAIGITQVATRRHADVTTLALTELISKVLIAVAIIPRLGATGLALSALCALIAAMTILRIKGGVQTLKGDSQTVS
jgi:hypothetical protein